MSKTPPGVKRVVAVLNFFAEHPGQSFNFTDIVNALDLGRATCHSLLAGLVEAQYLYRNTDKTYVIGSALAAIGKIAHEQFSPLQATQPELRTLSDECRAICSAVYHEQGNAVIKARAGSGSHLGWSMQGHSLPLRAPFAGPFFATAKPYEIDKWLDQLSPKTNDKEREDLLNSIQFVRQRGYSFGVFDNEVVPDPKVPEEAFFAEKAEYPVLISDELEQDSHYHLAYITSPVLNQRDEVEFVLNLSGFKQVLTGAQVEAMGKKLRDAAARITYFMNGHRTPYPFPKP